MTRIDQAVLKSLQDDPLVVSVVGHTNHGKSSTVRTLIENSDFGKVSPEPVKMHDTQAYRLQENLSTVAMVYDTPGLSSASEAIQALGHRPKVNDIQRYYDSHEKHLHERIVFEHLSQKSSLILFVVDIRQPCRDEYKDELLLILKCGIPIVPIMNFSTTSNDHRADWEEAFTQEAGAHAYTSFDAWRRSPADERRLIDNMLHVMQNRKSHHIAAIEWWRDGRIKTFANRKSDALHAVAAFAIDSTAFGVTSSGVEKGKVKKATAQLRAECEKQLDQRHARLLRGISRIYQFNADQELQRPPPKRPVAAEITKQLIEASPTVAGGAAAGVATGAAIGASIDSMLLWSSAGLGTAVGATVGGVVGAIGGRAKEFRADAVSRNISCRVKPKAIELLTWQSLKLAHDLAHRGAANEGRLKLPGATGKIKQSRLEAIKLLLTEVRTQVHESTFDYCAKDSSPAPFPKWTDRLTKLVEEIWDKDLSDPAK